MRFLLLVCVLVCAARPFSLPAQSEAPATRRVVIREARPINVEVASETVTVRFPCTIEHIQGVGFAAGSAGRFGGYLINQPGPRTIMITRVDPSQTAPHPINLIGEDGVIMMWLRPAAGPAPTRLELVAEEG